MRRLLGAARSLCWLDGGLASSLGQLQPVQVAVVAAVCVLSILAIVAAYTFRSCKTTPKVFHRLGAGLKIMTAEDDHKKMTPPASSRPKKKARAQFVDVIVTDPSTQSYHLIHSLLKDDAPSSKRPDDALPGDAVPSAKEMALAEAARARLYGVSVGSDEGLARQQPPVLPSGPEPAATDVVYLTREDLLEIRGGEGSIDAFLDQGLQDMSSQQWQDVVAGLNKLRRLSMHHSSSLQSRLHEVVPLVVQHVRSLRSSVCKTALLCVSDLFTDFGDSMLPWVDVGGASTASTSLLSQLFLKAASKDKRFVIEEAERSLQRLSQTLSPLKLKQFLLPYLVHKNQKVRGAAATCVAEVLARMPDCELIGDTSLATNLQVVAPLISDKTQEAREAARQIVLTLHSAVSRQQENDKGCDSWDGLVSACLSRSDALSIIKITAPRPRQTR